MARTHSAFFAFATLLPFIPLTAAGCNWPDRTDRNLVYDTLANESSTRENYQPCPASPGQSYSMCCAWWNECQTNGLCWDPAAVTYWCESCSDISWESSACIKLFINDTGASDDETITECIDGSFCFGPQNIDCCDAGEGVYVIDGVQKAHNFNATSSSTSTMSSTSTISSTSTSLVPTSRTSVVASNTATNTISPTAIPESSTLSTGAKAGIGVWVALGALITLTILIWVLMRRRRRNTGPAVPAAPAEELNAGPSAHAPAGLTSETTLEKKNSSFQAPVTHEVESVHRVEMPSTPPALYQNRNWHGAAELGTGL